MRRAALVFSLLTLMMFGVGRAASAQVSIGIQIGPPPPPRVIPVIPPNPGPEFVWVGGYWYPAGHRYRWHEGYWTRQPYPYARWIEPRYDGEWYYNGYWDGDRGRFKHEHRWDRDRDRDWRRWERDRDRDRDDDRDRQ